MPSIFFLQETTKLAGVIAMHENSFFHSVLTFSIPLFKEDHETRASTEYASLRGFLRTCVRFHLLHEEEWREMSFHKVIDYGANSRKEEMPFKHPFQFILERVALRRCRLN